MSFRKQEMQPLIGFSLQSNFVLQTWGRLLMISWKTLEVCELRCRAPLTLADSHHRRLGLAVLPLSLNGAFLNFSASRNTTPRPNDSGTWQQFSCHTGHNYRASGPKLYPELAPRKHQIGLVGGNYWMLNPARIVFWCKSVRWTRVKHVLQERALWQVKCGVFFAFESSYCGSCVLVTWWMRAELNQTVSAS